MRFDFTAQPATFLARPNRYLVVVRLADGSLVHAHCADPGRLKELLIPGARVYVSPATAATNSLRRTTWDLRLVEHPQNGNLVSIDTRVPNRLFREGVQQGFFEEFRDLASVRAEVPAPTPVPSSDKRPARTGIPHSRFDYRLEHADGSTTWVEVKSASLVVERMALFPDAVTARGRRHLTELAELRRQGERTAVVFIVQRPDADGVMAHRATDPAFADAMEAASHAGVDFLAATARVSLAEVALERRVPVIVA